MEPSYSVLADALSKFHTAPEWIQALWLVVVPVTMLGMTGLLMRGLAELTSILSRRERWMIYRHGRQPVEVDWTDPLPELVGGEQFVRGVFRMPEA
jgi:hypothetical protein